MLILTSPVTGGEMTEIAREANTLAETLGIATLLFFAIALVVIALIVFIKTQSREKESTSSQNTTTLHKVIDTLREDKEKDRAVLMGVLEDNRQQIEITRRVVEKIDAHGQAMQVLLNKTSQLLENRCINQLNKLKK